MLDPLAARVREKVARGLLPAQAPTKLWVRMGDGSRCDGCDRLVSAADEEYELQFPGGKICRFHDDCLKVWHRVITGAWRVRRSEGEAGGASSGAAG